MAIFLCQILIGQTNHTINAGNFYYTPSSLTINQGDIVTWIKISDKDRFNKYCYVILNDIMSEGIDRQRYSDLRIDDLLGLGIVFLQNCS